jgi:cold shock CspA family protein
LLWLAANPAHLFQTNKDFSMTGTIAIWKPDNNYGFIQGDTGGRTFFHKSGVRSGLRIREGDRVRYELEANPRGPVGVRIELE